MHRQAINNKKNFEEPMQILKEKAVNGEYDDNNSSNTEEKNRSKELRKLLKGTAI